MAGMKTRPHRIASGLAPFTPCYDRFLTTGYREGLPFQAQVEAAAGIPGLGALVLVWPAQFQTASEIKPLLARHHLALATLEFSLYADRRWSTALFSTRDQGLRREAIETCRRGIDVALEAGADDVLLWPGQDGFDYPFQADYPAAWSRLVDTLGEIASYRPQMRISIEYKRMEPRANIYVRNAGVLLALLRDLNLPNVGGTVDLGHSLYSAENPAEAAMLLARAGKLFQVHVNDNYRDWDHDLVVGSVHLWETLEFFYWVERAGYTGWYQIDSYPYRDDGRAALLNSVERTRWLIDRARDLQATPLADHLARGDAMDAGRLVWERVLRPAPGAES